jgi:hypothetical protein
MNNVTRALTHLWRVANSGFRKLSPRSRKAVPSDKKPLRTPHKEIDPMATNQQNTPQDKNKQATTPGRQDQFANPNEQSRQATGRRDQSNMQQTGRDRDLDEQNQRKDKDKDRLGGKSGH